MTARHVGGAGQHEAGHARSLGRGLAVVFGLSLVLVGMPGDTRPEASAGLGSGMSGPTGTGRTVAELAAVMTESIKDKQKNVVAETCAAMDDVAESGLVDPGSLARERAQCDVAERAAEAVTDDEIQAVAIKRGASATVYAEYTGPDRNLAGDSPSWDPGSPTLEEVDHLGPDYAYNGDGDGICNARGKVVSLAPEAAATGHGKPLTGYSEWCAEVVGDRVGDDDGFCEKQNPTGKEKAFEERCVEIAPTFADVTAKDENLDLERLGDYDRLLGEAETTARSFHAATREAVALLTVGATEAAAGGAKACPANQDRLKENGIALGIVTGLAVGLEGIANTIGAFSDQVVVAVGFGGNTASAKSVLWAVATAAHVTATALEVTADIDTATNVTNTLECLSDFRGESEKAMNELSEDVAALSQISLEVVELKEKTTYLITATLSGRPLAGVTLTAVAASTRSPIVFETLKADAYAFSESTGAPGTYALSMSLPPSLSNAGLFVFDVQYQAPDGPIYGHVLFDRGP